MMELSIIVIMNGLKKTQNKNIGKFIGDSKREGCEGHAVATRRVLSLPKNEKGLPKRTAKPVAARPER